MWGLWLIRYLFCCSYSHNVAPKGKFIAFVSTEAETDQPEIELKPGIDLLGPVDEIFFDMYDRYEPVNEPSLDNCFISTVIFLPHPWPLYNVDLSPDTDWIKKFPLPCQTELRCHNTLWVNSYGCSEHVHHDNWQGKTEGIRSFGI